MDFKEYIQGKRRGKAANELERKALYDPFLQDAIDGFDSVPGEHLPIIEQLEKQITGKQKHRNLWWIGVAASVVLIIGIGILIAPEKETNLAADKAIQQIEKTAKTIEKNSSKTTIANANSDSVKTIASHIPKINNKLAITETLEEVNDEISIVQTDNFEIQSVIVEAPVAAPIQPDTNSKNTAKSPTISAPTKPIYKIKGVVSDEKGEPLVGATVKFENSMNSAITDLDGKFEIPASRYKNDPLKVSYIGYNEKKLEVNNENISVQLEPNSLALNEVVVVGYGAQKRTSVTGAISSTKSTLQGKAAGIAVSKYSFGKTEFKTYFEKTRKTNLCNNEPTKLKAKFKIDEFGRPTELTITDCDCPELRLEFARIINQSPNWSEKNKNVELILRIN